MGELRRLYYQTNDYYSFKRFMWRWDKTVSSNAFQMGRIQIGNVDLPYTYVTSARGSGTGSSYGENADKLLIAESTGVYDKWFISNLTSGSDSTWGYVIFELPTQVESKTYRLRTTNDSGAGNYPRRMRLYGTNDETSDPDSASWTLISDVESFTFPTGHFEWSNEIPITPRETNNYYLLAPSEMSRGSGLRFEMPDYELMYLSYMTQLSGQNDVPLVNKIGGVWNFNSRRTGTSNVSISGAMPNTYSGQKYASFGGAGVTGILPVTTLRKFTICGWMRSNTSGAGEFWGVRYHTAFNYIWFYFSDATNYLNFNFGLADSNYTIYEATSKQCPTSIATKSGWAYVCLYIDRDENRCEYWVNNHHMMDISGKADLFNGNQNFDTILRFYPDANYSGFYLCELAIWSGQRKTDVPTEPLSNVYGS